MRDTSKLALEHESLEDLDGAHEAPATEDHSGPSPLSEARVPAGEHSLPTAVDRSLFPS